MSYDKTKLLVNAVKCVQVDETIVGGFIGLMCK